jgi:hypothetical protein
MNYHRSFLFAPSGGFFHVTIVGSRNEHGCGAVGTEFDPLTRSAGKRNIIFLRAIDSALGCIFLENVDPCRGE